MRPASLSIVLLLGVATAFASEPTVEAVLAAPEKPWLRAFTYTLIVEGDPSLECEFPELAADVKQVEARSDIPETVHTDDGRKRIVKEYVLDPIFPGQYMTPPLTIAWQSGDGSGTLPVSPMAFSARELTPAEEEAAALFTGIDGPDAVLPPRRVSRTTAAGILALAALLVAALALALWRWRGEKEAPVVVVPPWDIALNRLRELERRDLPGGGKIDAYYVDLSSILRYYIEDRFHIHAPEQTTPEFIEAAAQRRIFTDDQQVFLNDFLRQCDRVKFARLQPGIEDMTSHFKEVRHFVKETIPAVSDETSLEEAA